MLVSGEHLNPYKVLQVDSEAEPEVIDAAYRRLASKYHPDKDPSPAATERMKQINAAYEVLKDAERRAEHDEERAQTRAERRRQEREKEPERPAPAPPARSEGFPVEEVSNRVFKKVLGAAAVIALLVYLPWLAAIVAAVWAAVWSFKKFPKAAWNVVRLGVALVVFAGIYVWRQDSISRERREREEKELADLDVRALLGTELAAYVTSCTASATWLATDLRGAYCTCLADILESRFDASPITATSVWGYKEEFKDRLRAASPTAMAQTFCAEKVQPKRVALPAVGKLGLKPAAARKAPKPAPTAEDIDRSVLDALAAPQQ